MPVQTYSRRCLTLIPNLPRLRTRNTIQSVQRSRSGLRNLPYDLSFIFSEESYSRFSAQKEEKLYDEKMALANAKIKQAGEYRTLITLLLVIVVKVKYMRRSRKRKPLMSAKSMLAISTLSTHWVPKYHRRNSTWVYSKNPGVYSSTLTATTR